MEGLRQSNRNLFRLSYQIIVFGNRHRHSDYVRFLESVSTDSTSSHLPRDCHQRHRIHMGIRQSGHQIGGSWPRSYDCYSGFPARECITFRRMSRGLFVTHNDLVDLRVIERIENRHDCPAG